MTNRTVSSPPKSFCSRVLGIAGWLLGLAFGRWAGVSFLIPAGLSVAAYYILKRFMSGARAVAILPAAIQFGQLGWICLGLLAPGGFAQVWMDILVLGGLLLWFCVKPIFAPAIALLAYQTISLAVNIYTATVTTNSLQAISVHILFRLTAIGLIIYFLAQRARQRDASVQNDSATA